jgi:hypothetical protein
MWTQYGSVNNLWRLKPLLDKQSPPTRTKLTEFNRTVLHVDGLFFTNELRLV